MPEVKRAAIVGLGIMGRRMLENMIVHPAFEPVALWDPADSACAAAAALAPDAAVAADAEAAMSAAEVIYLACPPVPRKAYALAAAAAGKPIFMEKPLGVDNAESSDLVARLEAAGAVAAVNFTQASSRALDHIVADRDAGGMGTLAGVDIVITYPAWPRAWQAEADWLRFRAEGGFTREVISHFLFVSRRLLGPLSLVHSYPSFPPDRALCETHILARLEAGDGTPVTVMGSVGGRQPDRQEITVKGRRKSYRLTDFYRLWQSDGGDWTPPYAEDGDPRRNALQRQLDSLAAAMAGKSTPLATPREALEVQLLVENMLQPES
jgi:predicted dehydrogenase